MVVTGTSTGGTGSMGLSAGQKSTAPMITISTTAIATYGTSDLLLTSSSLIKTPLEALTWSETVNVPVYYFVESTSLSTR